MLPGVLEKFPLTKKKVPQISELGIDVPSGNLKGVVNLAFKYFTGKPEITFGDCFIMRMPSRRPEGNQSRTQLQTKIDKINQCFT